MTGSVPTRLSWVIGAGGLLGKALTSRFTAAGDVVLTSSISWATDRAADDLAGGIDRLAGAAAEYGLPWRIAWCAGAGVTGTTQAELDEEVSTFRSFLAELARTARGPGTVFLASSAGGIYAGGQDGAPYDEFAEAHPISPYGHAKLTMERIVESFGRATGNQVLIGRISNLYGPGQNLSKGQGLISQLCRASLTRQPVSVFVSLDTIRDYLYVDDCAALIADLLDHHPVSAADPVLLKVLAAGRGTTIGALLAVSHSVLKRAPLVVLGSSPTARFQVKDLRLRSAVLPELDRRVLTPLPVGIAATFSRMRRTAQLPTR